MFFIDYNKKYYLFKSSLASVTFPDISTNLAIGYIRDTTWI